MVKRAVIGIFALTLVSFVSAASFSVSEFLDKIDSSTIVLGTLFLIFFAMLYFILSRVFTKKTIYGKEPNQGIATVLALSISLLIVYGLNKLDFNLEDIFFNLGFSSDLTYTLILFIFIGGTIFLGFKTKWHILLVLGIFFILLSLFDIVTESFLVMIIGVITLFVYFGIKFFGKKNTVSIENRRKR